MSVHVCDVLKPCFLRQISLALVAYFCANNPHSLFFTFARVCACFQSVCVRLQNICVSWSAAMGRKSKETSQEDRRIVVRLYEEGKSFKYISNTIARPITTVKNIVFRFQRSNKIQNAPRNGRPSKLSPKTKRRIERKIANNPKLSAPKIA